MMDAIAANFGVHLKFYRRNRILLYTLLILAMLCIPVVSIQMMSVGDKFEMLQRAVTIMSTLVALLGAVLGLITFSQPYASRSLKMVFTKPCPPEAWILSAFLAGGAVLAALYGLILAGASAMFLIWNLPFQWGVVLVAAQSFMEAFLIFGWMLFLTMIMPPVAAGAIGLVLNASLMKNLLQMVILNESGNPGWFTAGAQGTLKYLLMAFYVLLPEYSPFQKELQDLATSYRFNLHALGYAALSGVYILLISAFFFCASDAILRRRNFN
jgi:ABC-type transport system involved in multi-copper enzyme maturation permease subunit